VLFKQSFSLLKCFVYKSDSVKDIITAVKMLVVVMGRHGAEDQDSFSKCFWPWFLCQYGNNCVVCIRHNWRELNLFFALNNNTSTVYCNFIFACRIQRTFVTSLYEVNWMLKHRNGDWRQIPAKRSNTIPTVWLHSRLAKCTPRHTPPLAHCISCYHSRQHQRLRVISILCTAWTAHSWLSCHIRSR
jgi:hypothetical protein